MPKLPPDYEGIAIRKWREFAEDVPRELLDGEKRIKDKIRGFSKKFGYDYDAVCAHVMDSEMFAATFAKDPLKTGYHEREAAKWISELEQVDAFKTLPKTGQNALYVREGGEISDAPRQPRRRGLKSLDFRWRTGKFTIYAMHKHSKEAGGHQTGQYLEILRALERFQKAGANEKEVLMAIVDGDMYAGDRLTSLRALIRHHPPFSFAVPIEEVPVTLNLLLMSR